MIPRDFAFKTEAETIAYNMALIDVCPKIMDIIGKDSANYCIEFLGFLEVYRYALHRLKGTRIDTIIDVGCGAAIQSLLIKDKYWYWGVDASDGLKLVDVDVVDALEWIEDNADYFSQDHTLAICSAVPNRAVRDEVKKRFKYHLVTYPTAIESENFPLAGGKK